MEDIKDDIIKRLFPDRSNEFAGYWNIVEYLIRNERCISTMDTFTIDYGTIHNYINFQPYDGGVGLIEMSFNKSELINSYLFKEEKEKFIKEYENEIFDTKLKLKYWESVLKELKEM